MSKKPKKTAIPGWMDESSPFDKWLEDKKERALKSMMQDPALFLQQHPIPLGGQSHGNRTAAAQAYSSAANLAHPAQQGAQSAAAQQGAQSAAAQQSLNNQRALQNIGGLGSLPQLLPAQHQFDWVVKPEIKHAGTKFGEFLGWRMWYVRDGLLKSYSRPTFWQPKVPMTGTPSDHKDDGIWAFKDKNRAIRKALEAPSYYSLLNFNQEPGAPAKPVVVWGSVKLYGEVVEHQDGYRASAASIVSIDDAEGAAGSPVEKHELLTNLREKYLE